MWLDLNGAVIDEPCHGLTNGLQRAVARLVVDQPPGLGDAVAVRAVLQVSQRCSGVPFGHTGTPGLERLKAEVGFPAEPAGDGLCVTAQGQGCRRDGVETLTDRGVPVLQRFDEELCDVIRVDVMNDLTTLVGEDDVLTARELGVELGIEVRCRV